MFKKNLCKENVLPEGIRDVKNSQNAKLENSVCLVVYVFLTLKPF